MTLPTQVFTVTRADLVRYADASGDHNPIHIDPAAAAQSPFGTTIAHGYLTLSLVVPLMAQYFEVTDVGTAVNYGLDKLRFPAPVPVGSRIRTSSVINEVAEIKGGVQVHVQTTFEVEGGTKPAVVAQMLLRYYA
jgi:acyl dehydratase